MRKTFITIAAVAALSLAAPPAARAESAKCEPAFVKMYAELLHASVVCGKNYMKTTVGRDVTIFAHECPTAKIRSILQPAWRNWDRIAKEQGKDAVCAITDEAFKGIEAAASGKD